MIHIRLTKMRRSSQARGFKDANALYLNPYTISEYRPFDYEGLDKKEIPISLIYLTNGRSHEVEETPDQILGLIHLATRRNLPRSIACVDVTVMKKLFDEAGEREGNE